MLGQGKRKSHILLFTRDTADETRLAVPFTWLGLTSVRATLEVPTGSAVGQPSFCGGTWCVDHARIGWGEFGEAPQDYQAFIKK